MLNKQVAEVKNIHGKLLFTCLFSSILKWVGEKTAKNCFLEPFIIYYKKENILNVNIKAKCL